MKQRDEIRYIYLSSSPEQSVLVEHFANWTLPPDNVYTPHRHAYQQVVWFQAGHGQHAIDGQSFTITPRTVCLIAQGQVHQFETTQHLTGYVLRFTDNFLQQSTLGSAWHYGALFNYLSGDQTLPIPQVEFEAGEVLLGLILTEYKKNEQFGRSSILGHLIYTLLLQIERFKRATRHHDTPALSAPGKLYQDFIQLLEQNFQAHHNVMFYAQELHHTPSHLSRVLQQTLGKPAKRVILERLLIEARRYLQFTDLSVKEIALALGFASPFHFSKFFKREVGLSPQAYRAKIPK